MQKQKTNAILVAVLLILAAAISRVVMYPDNFSPMIGMAIFGGAIINDKRLAFALPIFSMLLSDVLFEVCHIAPGFWGWGQLVGYGIFALITVLAFSLKKVTVPRVAAYSVGSSILFFILSNASFFFIDNTIYHTYPQTANGFVDCYVQALPFLKTGILADLVYSGVLFGSWYLFNRYAIRKSVA